MSAPPLAFWWNGEAMLPRQPRLADKHFVVGERYTLVEHNERSSASHAHYFAALTEAWSNLPEDQAERFPTSEHLRAFALIKTGFADSRQFVASSKAEALRLAAFMKPSDDYALVTVKDAVVTVWTAKSQSYRAMGKADFNASKQAVLDYVASLVGVKPGDLAENAARAA